MSGPLRQILGPAKAYLRRHLSESPEERGPLHSVDSDTSTTVEDHRYNIELSLNKIRRTVSLIEKKQEEWN